MKNPIYAIRIKDVLELVEAAPDYTPLAFGDLGKENLNNEIRSLVKDKQNRVNMSKLANLLEDAKTGKMVGGANKGIEWVIRELKQHRVPVGRLYKFSAYTYAPCGISYDAKRIHLDSELTITCKKCGASLEHPGTDFLYIPSYGKTVFHGCDDCSTYESLFELEGIDDSNVFMRFSGEEHWKVEFSSDVIEMPYKHHCK